MSLADEMSADFTAIHADLPSFVDIGGAQVAALVSQGSLSEELDLGGFNAQNTLTVKMRKADLANLPKVGYILYYNNNAYRINSITAKASIPLIELECLQK